MNHGGCRERREKFFAESLRNSATYAVQSFTPTTPPSTSSAKPSTGTLYDGINAVLPQAGLAQRFPRPLFSPFLFLIALSAGRVALDHLGLGWDYSRPAFLPHRPSSPMVFL